MLCLLRPEWTAVIDKGATACARSIEELRESSSAFASRGAFIGKRATAGARIVQETVNPPNPTIVEVPLLVKDVELPAVALLRKNIRLSSSGSNTEVPTVTNFCGQFSNCL